MHYFRLAMYCPCCQNRRIWCSGQKIESMGSKGLQELANQFKLFWKEDIEICSELTNEILDEPNNQRQYRGNTQNKKKLDFDVCGFDEQNLEEFNE